MGLVEEEDGMDALAAEILDVGGGGGDAHEEARPGGSSEREPAPGEVRDSLGDSGVS